MSYRTNLGPEAEKQLAESYGFVCALDSGRGDEWCSFAKGNNHIWQIAKTGHGTFFQTALMNEDDELTKHKYFTTLEEALKHCNNRRIE